ncbi:MAG: hypothetical protein QXZ17_12335 [Nitrososphaerota archaeon]
MNCSKPDGIVDMSSGYGLGMDFLKAGKREEDDKSLYVLAGGTGIRSMPGSEWRM